ncbi:MAG TPA: hypothetical protein ENF48_13040 [Desulfobacteraceae bacterium]|nr:hypothetical protein [Deltaproteobacteria bacterium]RLB95011.1 MAG: hypothetical protein DRH76_08685 [Deltaproteobacteria bacterium]HDI61253.1 hypothetical protein [Desulfobacteraceae bacterium]
MPDSLPGAKMNQRIFKLGLAVETISAYLLCCALADEGRPLTRSGLLRVWTASPGALDRALSELIDAAILEPVDTEDGYRILPASAWRRT